MSNMADPDMEFDSKLEFQEEIMRNDQMMSVQVTSILIEPINCVSVYIGLLLPGTCSEVVILQTFGGQCWFHCLQSLHVVDPEPKMFRNRQFMGKVSGIGD